MATETQRFQVGDEVRVNKYVHGDIARHAGKEGVIESVITPENDQYYYVRSGGVVLDKFFYADELVSCAPAPDSDLDQLRAENAMLRGVLQPFAARYSWTDMSNNGNLERLVDVFEVGERPFSPRLRIGDFKAAYDALQKDGGS